MRSPVARFVVAALAWLPLMFALWYLLAPVLLWPVQVSAAAVARAAFGDIVQAVEGSGTTISFLTSLRPGQPVGGGRIIVDVNPLLYTFGMPMFASLVLAAREPRWLRHLLAGYVVLVPFAAFGVVADFLKSVAISAGPMVVSQTGFGPLDRETIAFAYQFGSLILPTVAPAVLWVLFHRRFLERLRAPDREEVPGR